MKVTLSEFIEIGLAQGRANLHLQEPGFELFYARFNKRYINGKMYLKVLDIANISVEPKLRGTGVFTRLVRRLRKQYPWMTLYVENAAPLFQELLRKLEFKEHDINPDCFFLEGENAPVEEIHVPNAGV